MKYIASYKGFSNLKFMKKIKWKVLFEDNSKEN